MITKETLLPIYGEFSWDFGQNFFIETKIGNFVWSDPDYNGDNTIRLYHGTLEQFLKETGNPYVRDKGTHSIERYCGNTFTFI